MAFPSSIPSYLGFTSTHTLAVDQHASQHNQEQADIIALANKVGVGAATPGLGLFLVGTAPGATTYRALTTADIGFSPLSVLQQVYPVGCIYAETTGVNPSTTFGFGTWVVYGPGRVLVGNGTSDQAFVAGNTGGESNHVLSVGELAVHSHGVTDPGHLHTIGVSGVGGVTIPLANGGAVGATNNTSGATTGLSVNSAGSSSGHNNLQPYQVVYYWTRTA